MIEKIRKIVKKEADLNDWRYHINVVIKYAKKLGKIYNVDLEILELGALLHDIGRIKVGPENHHITGEKEAEKILEQYKYPKNIIKEIKHCIKSHRGSTDITPKTIFAKIIANADAIAHFDSFPIFFFSRAKNNNFQEILKWVDNKIEKGWNKKLTLPEARKMCEKKYKAIRLILDSIEK